MQDNKNLGLFIKNKRTEKNYTQEQLAEMLFVTKSAVSKWERGISYPDITMIDALCKALDVSEHELVTATEDGEDRLQRRQARLYRQICAACFYVPTICYLVALAVCFICNLAVDGRLNWFFVVFSALVCAFCFLPGVYRYFPQRRLLAFAISTFAGISVLLFTCAAYTRGLYWFLTAFCALAAFYALLFAPILLSVYPVGKRAKKYRFFIAFALATFFSLCLTASVAIFHAFDFLAALAVLAYFSLMLFACAGTCLLRCAKLVQAGICTLISGAFTYFSEMVIGLFFPTNYIQDYRVDFGDWKNFLTGNVALLSLVVVAITGAALILFGALAARKNRAKKEKLA